MKSFKKLLAVVLSLAMVLGSLSVTALAAETEISTLAQLKTALTTGGEYKLTADITSTTKDFVTVGEGVDVTIDLNGYKLARSSSGSFAVVTGTLTIKDTATGGIFGTTATGTTTGATLMVVSGEFNLESGTLQGQKTSAQSAKLISNTGTFNMSGGTITKLAMTSASTSGMGIENKGTFNMTGGTITGNDVSAANRRLLQNNASTAIMNLSGGEITGNSVGDKGSDINVYNGTVNISGDMMVNGKLAVATGKVFNITGGWFSAQPIAAWIAEGYEWKADTKTHTGYAGYVAEKQSAPAVAKIGDTEYEDVDTALAAAKDGETVLLVDNCESDTRTTISAGAITLDLNGKTLTCASQATNTDARLANVNAGGTLTIDDKSTGTPGKIIAPTKCASSAAIAYAYKGTLIIKNGRFQDGGAEQTESVFGKGKDGTLEVYGGYYTESSKEGLSDYVKGDDDTKIYGIVEDSTYAGFAYTVGEVAPQVTVDGKGYLSFDAAMNAIEDGSTVKLLADCVKTDKITTIAAETTVTLDLNGYALTNAYENATKSSQNFRYFTVAGTLNITDTSVAQTGSITANQEYTGTGAIVYGQATGTINIDAGTYYDSPAGPAANNCFTRASGATYNVTGGWYTERAYQYEANGYYKVVVTDTSKASSPITVSNKTKTINYLKNGGAGTDVPKQTYAYLDGYTTVLNTKSLSYTKKGSTCVGWSTNSAADPDGSELIGGGDPVNFADDEKYPADAQGNVDLYAIYKSVNPSMWVCVDTEDNTVGYADLASAFVESTDVTLIKNFNGRSTIEVAGDRRLNLNGYNIKANTPDDATGSAIVVKTSSGALSIYNEDAGIAGFSFGGEGKVEGYAQGTGGAIDVIGSVGASVKIYGGTFTGDAPTHGTVLVCSGVGKAYIYGGTFIPANSESTVDALYANNGKIFVMAENQSDVKIQGVIAKNTSGSIGIIGGYFSDLQPAATVGTYDETNDRIVASDTESLIANTDDATYPYSVGATPWYITYNYGDGTAPASANPAMVAKDDATEITLNAPTPAAGYAFTGYKDADGNLVTSIIGAKLEANLTLTAQYEIITYTIEYTNVPEGVANTNPTSYTISDAVAFTALENCHFKNWAIEGVASEGWEAGQTGDVTVDAVIYAQHSITYSNIDYAGVTAPSQTSFYEDEAVTLEAIADREAYYFNGWHTGSKTGPKITDWAAGEQTADVTVYAGWSTPEAIVTIGENTTLYPEFADAIAAVKNCNEAATLKLTKDVTVEARIDLGTQADLTLNLNGKTLTEKTATNSGIIIYGGALTITGAGKMVDATEKTDANKSIVCQRADATLAIESGTFTTFTKTTSNASKDNPGAGAVITGGTFSFDPTAEVDAALYQVVKKEATTEPVAPESWTVYEAAAQVTVGETTTGYRYMKSVTTAQSALDNVAEGSTLTLLKDAVATYKFAGEEKTFTIDLNGYEYDLNKKFSADDGYSVAFELQDGETDVYTVKIAAGTQFDPKEIYVSGTASETVGMAFEANIAVPEGVKKPVLKYTNPATGEELTIKPDATETAGSYKFSIDGIYINNIGNNLGIEIVEDGETTGTETAVQSIAQYYEKIYETYNDVPGFENTIDLIASLLNFGSELQKISGVGESFTPSTWASEKAKGYSVDGAVNKMSRTGDSKLCFKSITLNITDQSSIMFNLTEVPENSTVRVVDSNNQTVKIFDADKQLTDSLTVKGDKSIKTARLNPTQFDEQITCIIENGGKEIASATYTVNSYCKNMANHGTAGNIAKAIYNYGVAFNACN